MNRREFLQGLAGLSGAAALLSDPASSGIEHIVVVMMENRSFDHLLGWLPNSDGRQRGLWYPDAAGAYHPTFPLAPDFTGCGRVDPDHSYVGGRIQYNRGAMNGFLVQYEDDQYPIGYYAEADRPFLNALARWYTTLDRSFCSILGPTYPNRFFLHSAQTDRLSNTATLSTLPTIWDSLEREGVSHGYYYSNLPFLAFWGLKYLGFSRPYSRFLFDALTGALPAVSIVDPRFTFGEGGGNDDHPHSDVRAGDAFLSQAFHAVAAGPDWSSTVFIVTYDEWGGFFDHVPPPRADAANGLDPDLVGGKARLGLRVPTIVASPWSRGWALNPRVHHGTFDHTSILKLIEWRWGLRPLTARDASPDVLNLVSVLDFDSPRVPVPWLPRPVPPSSPVCKETTAAAGVGRPAGAAEDNNWQALLDSGLLAGWPVYV
jgi:phospholipase C